MRSTFSVLLLSAGFLVGAIGFAQQPRPLATDKSESRLADQAGEKLDKLDKQTGHLEQEVLMMLGLSGLVIAVLFGSIVFGEYRIKKAVEETEDQLRAIRRRFPKFAEIETELSEVTIELESKFESSEWTEDRYTSLAIESRQHLLTVEHLIPFGLEDSVTSALLRGFANFYFSKYAVEKVAADLDRALYYALRARRRGKSGFQYLNDLGLIYMELAARDPAYWTDAEECLEESKRRNRQQQRCYYNLGLIHFDRGVNDLVGGDHEMARHRLIRARSEWENGLEYSAWEMTSIPGLASLIHYNLACVLCRLALLNRLNGSELDSVLVMVIGHLDEATRFRNTKPETLLHDLTASHGDLAVLWASTAHRQHVVKIQGRLNRIWNS